MFHNLTWPEAWVYIVAFLVLGGVAHKLLNYLIFSLRSHAHTNTQNTLDKDE
jgi:hypothetical protein